MTPTPKSSNSAPNAQAVAVNDNANVVIRLSLPLRPEEVEMRQDGKTHERNGKYYARFVPYTTAQAIRRRLDDNFPGQWSFDVEALPPLGDSDGRPLHAVKGTLRIQTLHFVVNRADIGQGSDWKAAATDAFKRAAQRLGIGNELYEMEQVWVEVNGAGKYAKPTEDPVAKLFRVLKGEQAESIEGEAETPPAAASPSDVPPCPKCGGRMWDNRKDKRNPKAPDFKCRDRSCDGLIWPAKSPTTVAPTPTAPDVRPFADIVNEESEYGDDGLPF